MAPETKAERSSSRIQRSITRLKIIERTPTAQDSLDDSEDSDEEPVRPQKRRCQKSLLNFEDLDDEPVRQQKPRGQKSTFLDLSRIVLDVEKEHLDLETEICTLKVKLEEREDHTDVLNDEVRRMTAEVKATANLRVELAKVKGELMEGRSKLGTVGTTVKGLEADVSTVQQERDQLETEVTRWKERETRRKQALAEIFREDADMEGWCSRHAL